MSARETIFKAIRAVRPDRASPREIAAQAEACTAAMRKTLPDLPTEDLPGLFAAFGGA